MANDNDMGGPRGFRGASDPRAGFTLNGVEGNQRYSQQEIDRLKKMAERDAWESVRDAFSRGNHPVIFREFNPLLRPAGYENAPECWMVYVPHTSVAWKPRQIIHDHTRKPNPQMLVDRQMDDPDAQIATRKQIRDYQQNREILQEKLHQIQLHVFSSEQEAAADAQEVWRSYWAPLVSKQSLDSRKAFQQNAVIEPLREKAFTVDNQNPAHEVQYKLWLETHQGTLPYGVSVYHTRVRWEDLPVRQNVLLDEDAINHGDWDLERRTALAVVDDAWEVRSIGPKLWAVTHWDPDVQTWEFFANGTGRVVAYEAKTAEEVLYQVPRGVPVVVGKPGAHVPSAEQMHDLWVLARDHANNVKPDLEVQTWLMAEQTFGKQLKQLMQDYPDHAARLRPVLQQVAAVHRIVMPEDGVIANEPAVLEQAHDHLEHVIQEQLRPGAVRDRMEGAEKFWRKQSATLSIDSLGLYARDRVADIHLRPDEAAFKQDASPFVASQTPSGRYILANTDKHDQVTYVNFFPFTSRDAVNKHVQNKDGYVTFENRQDVLDHWKEKVIHSRVKDPEALIAETVGDWVATRTPSGAYLLAQLSSQGALRAIDLQAYATQKDVKAQVAARQGFVSFEDRPIIIDAWKQRMEQSPNPEMAQRAEEVLTARRTLRQEAYAAKQAADPKVPQKAEPAAQEHLYVSPLGAGRALVWATPNDLRRHEQNPEFVAWQKGQLVHLNKHAKGWMPPLKPGEQRAWETIPEGKRPWIVASPDGLAAMVDQVAQKVPDASVQATVLPSPYLVRALVERYGVKPEPLSVNTEAVWTVHPTPQGTVMASTREWVAQEKEQRPGEYEVYAAARPLRKSTEDHPVFEVPHAGLLQRELAQTHMVQTTSDAMPPEVMDWFNPRLQKQSLAEPVIHWGPIDPWAAIAKAPRFTQEAFLDDLTEAQQDAQVPIAVQRMQRQVVAASLGRGLTARDFEAVLPNVPEETGVSWTDTERNMQDYAKLWLSERPKLAERLTHPATKPAVRKISTVAVSI